MVSATGLFLGLKSKILHEQNVIYFQFYIRLQNLRLLGSIINKKLPSWSIPLSILYRLFFETQGRKYGRNLSWSWYQQVVVLELVLKMYHFKEYQQLHVLELVLKALLYQFFMRDPPWLSCRPAFSPHAGNFDHCYHYYIL